MTVCADTEETIERSATAQVDIENSIAVSDMCSLREAQGLRGGRLKDGRFRRFVMDVDMQAVNGAVKLVLVVSMTLLYTFG